MSILDFAAYISNRKQNQATAPTTARATPIPPARIGVPREKEKPQNRAISESMGRQASPDKKPIKKVQLYIPHHPGTAQRNTESNRPRRSKANKNMQIDWPFNDNRHHQASVRPARDGYPQDRPPQILVQSKNELNSPYSLFSRSIISPQPASNGSFGEGMSLTGGDPFRSTTLSSRRLLI